MKKTHLIIILIISCQLLYAQKLQIKGKVLSSSGFPIEYANILLSTNDSIFITGGVSDIKGHFNMNNLADGEYLLRISSLGFTTQTLPLNMLNKNLDLGNITLDSCVIALNEVNITANSIIDQPDRKIILPTAHQLKASTNGLTLLQQMKLNRIQVDPLKNVITTFKEGGIQLRVNGVKVTEQEIAALRPEDIMRIEYHDDPGLRYGNVGVVIDYITRHKETGGFISFDVGNSPHVVFGNNQFTAKINHKKSEFTTSYYGGYRSGYMWRENRETFNYQNKEKFIRIEEGIPGKWSTNWNFINLNYSYQETEKTFLNISLRSNINNNPESYHNSILYPENSPEQTVNMTEQTSGHDYLPSLDIYFQQNLKKKQILILNVVGTYIKSNSKRTYQEADSKKLLTDIFTKTTGNKYSIIGEGIYEKELKTIKFSTGLKHTQSYTDNKYSGSTTAQNAMKQSETYLYAEIQGKINKFNYAFGVGGKRFWFYQEEKSSEDYHFRPTLRIGYAFSENASIRYRGSIDSYSPTLSSLNNVSQLIDSLQIRKGNPDLRPYKDLANSINFDYHKGWFSSNLSVGYYCNLKPIMEETFIENNKFIHTENNQKKWQKISTELELKAGPIKDILTLSLTTGLNHFNSEGHTYHHYYNNWYYRAEIMAMYKRWSCIFQIQNHRNIFFGETLEYGENFHFFGIMYKYKQLNVGVMSLNLFTDNWKMGSENRNQYSPSKNWNYVKESSRLFVLKASWSFSFGRKYQSGEKRINNQDNDSGVLSGSK